MKVNKGFVKKLVTGLASAVTMVSCFYTVSLLSNKDIVKAMEEDRKEVEMLVESYKWIDEEDIDPETGKLKEGVMYNIGGNNSFYTSEGFKEYEINYVGADSVTPVVEYKNAKPIVNIRQVANRDEILFSNDFMVDFDITYDETSLKVEKRKYNLVKTEYKQTSKNETRSRLVWKSKKVKIGFIKIKVYYLEREYYTEKVVTTTPIETYQEVVQEVGGINLEDNANILTKTVASLVDKHFPNIRTMSTTYGIPLLIMFMDTIVKTVKTVVAQILSIVADFIPVLDEIKTSYETVMGKDMFTGEEIGTFWRIFGAVMLAVTAVVSFVSFGAGGLVVDAAADTAQAIKKGKKLASKADDVLEAGSAVAKKFDNIRSIDGFADMSGDALKYVGKHTDEVTAALKKMDGDTVADLIEQGTSVTAKIDNVMDLGSTGTIKLANGVEITQVSKSSDVFNKKPFDRGFELDDFGGNNLGRTYKTVDKLDDSTDTVISIKSLDTRAKTYQDPSKFKSTINKYLDQVDADQFGQAGKEIYRGINFSDTGVDLYIPKEGFTKAQYDIIQNLKLKEGIKLNIFVLS